MNSSQKTVLWIGLAIILLNLSLQWSTFVALIFTGTPSASGGSAQEAPDKTAPKITTTPANPKPPVTAV